MTDPDDLAELTAWLAENHHRIPRHRRVQALRHLERVEALIPEPDHQHQEPHP